jgi:hypothetical protein
MGRCLCRSCSLSQNDYHVNLKARSPAFVSMARLAEIHQKQPELMHGLGRPNRRSRASRDTRRLGAMRSLPCEAWVPCVPVGSGNAFVRLEENPISRPNQARRSQGGDKIEYFRSVCRELSAMRRDPRVNWAGLTPERAERRRIHNRSGLRRQAIWNRARVITMIVMRVVMVVKASDPHLTPRPRTADPSTSHETENLR